VAHHLNTIPSLKGSSVSTSSSSASPPRVIIWCYHLVHLLQLAGDEGETLAVDGTQYN